MSKSSAVKVACCCSSFTLQRYRNFLNEQAFSETFFISFCKWLILSVKKFCLESAFAVLSCLSWCVQPPVTSPNGFTSRAYYIMHTGGRGGLR